MTAVAEKAKSMASPHTSNLSDAGKKVAELQEFVCGWGAAFINIAVTFPINKVMFRQMLHGVDSHMAMNELRHEGVRYLYRGILPPLLQKTGSAALMFGLYDQCQRFIVKSYPNVPSFVALSTSAIIAGTAEALLTPLERVQTLLQDRHYHNMYKNSAHAFRELSRYGLREYYRGLVPILIRNGPSNVMFFGLRGEVKKVFPQMDFAFHDVITDFFSGALIGALISSVFYPVNVIKTRMQSTVGGQFLSMRIVFLQIYEERGRSWHKIFYGVHVNYTRALLSWGIINASYELLKKILFHDAIS